MSDFTMYIYLVEIGYKSFTQKYAGVHYNAIIIVVMSTIIIVIIATNLLTNAFVNRN